MAKIFNFDEVVKAITRKQWNENSFADLRGVANTIDGFTYGPESIKTIPNRIQSLTYVNDAETAGAQRISDTKTTMATMSWTLRKGITSSTSQSIRAPLPRGIEVFGSQSQQISLERTESQVTTVTQTWNWDTTIPIPARSQIDVDILVDEIEVVTNFTAIAKFYGHLVIRKPAYTDPVNVKFGVGYFFTKFPAPQVTVLDECTIEVPIEGTLRNREGRRYRVEVHQKALQGSTAPTTFKAVMGTSSFLGFDCLARASEGGTIGVPDGIHYRVVSTREEVRPTPACGYNDAMAPIAAAFKVETRLCEEFSDGALVRSWTEDVETFDHCIDV